MHHHSPKHDPERWVQDHPKTGKPFDTEVGLNVTTAFAIGIVAISVLAMIGMWFLLSSWQDEESARDGAQALRAQRTMPPEPRLQIHAEADLQAFLAEQNARLQSSGWVDQAQDRGHIAIEEAMRLIAAQGLPVRSNPRHWTDPILWQDPTLSHLGEESN